MQKAFFAVDPAKELSEQMHLSDASGKNLLKQGPFAADLIRFPPGGKVELHTHPGNHMLFCIDGKGLVQYGDQFHELHPGVCYLIEGMVPHAVFADDSSQLTLIAIADEHYDVSSSSRLDMCDQASPISDESIQQDV